MNLKLDKIDAYGILDKDKRSLIEKNFKLLNNHHYKNSKEYKKFLNSIKYNINNIKIEKFPFLPTSIFKKIDLLSVNRNEIIKTISSSGTSGNSVSKIHLDKDNSKNQIYVLNKLVTNFIGKKRMPMLIIDFESGKKSKNGINARTAAINGFSIFGKNHTYLINHKKEIDIASIKNFIQKFGDAPFLIFGFTSLVYENLIANDQISNAKLDFKNGILLHGGGWKKMEDKKVSNKKFRQLLKQKINLNKVINYYGLAEQTGTIFLECEFCQNFIVSSFSEVIIRDKNFNVKKNGEQGLIQLMSLLPTSYPGHNILTEDLGMISDNKNCKCAKLGKTFKVFGRVKKSELKGCSDTL